jgi:hypothetical protein
MTEFRVAELPRDAQLLERAGQHARSIGEHDARLESGEHALLLDALGERYGPDALAPIRA